LAFNGAREAALAGVFIMALAASSLHAREPAQPCAVNDFLDERNEAESWQR